MASGDAPPSFSSGMINHFDDEQFPVDAQAVETPNDLPWLINQPPSQSSVGHGEGNSLNQFPDGILHREFGQPEGTSDDSETAPSFTAFGDGRGISNNQDWNSHGEDGDSDQALSRSAIRRPVFSNTSNGGHLHAGEEAPGFSDVDRRGISQPGGSSTDLQSSADEDDMAGMSLVGKNFQKYYPNAYYKEKDEK